MDNVVQNIKIEDIIPSNFQFSQEKQKKVEELAKLVKTFGIIDPILVRQKNGKYEIVLGIEKYQAAKLAGLNNVPVIIKEVDDDTFSKYLNIEKKEIHETKSKEALPNTFEIPLEKSSENNNLSTDSWKIKNSNNNSDIINLSELSKEEYERDDFKMNNEQLNNMINNNFEQQSQVPQQNQGPTFGGRFFPSLEDEPTNMNMNGTPLPQPTIPEMPNLNNINNNSNLIDLTDLSLDKEPTVQATPDFELPNLNNSVSDMNSKINTAVMPQADFSIPNQMKTQEPIIPQTDNIINLENLQNNNPIVQPILEPTPNTPINNDFGNQQLMQSQLNIPTNIAPQPEIVQPMNNMVSPQVGIGINSPTMVSQPEIQSAPTPSDQTPVEPVSMDILNADFGVPAPMATPSISNPIIEEKNQVPTQLEATTTKDITPVTNTIKNLVSNLETFGYKITINEEKLATTVKLTIEVEK